MATVTDGTNNIYFYTIEPGIWATMFNPSSLTGHLRVMVRTKKYNKLNYKYLPICSVEGEAYGSVNLNNTSMSKATAPASTAANFARATEAAAFAINYSTASGVASFASGRNSEAKGLYSHAEGTNTIASGKSQHAEGKYNIEDVENKYAHIIGNGTSYYDKGQEIITRSNAHTIDWDGNGWFAGTVEGTAMIIKSPNGTRFKITVSDEGTLSAAAITE